MNALALSILYIMLGSLSYVSSLFYLFSTGNEYKWIIDDLFILKPLWYIGWVLLGYSGLLGLLTNYPTNC